MPERTLPDGTVEIYEEPGTLGFPTPALSFAEIAAIVEENRRKLAEAAMDQGETDAGETTP